MKKEVKLIKRNAPQLTPWFNAKKHNPVRVGWYEYRVKNRGEESEMFWWNGLKWAEHPREDVRYAWSAFSVDEWRGVLK